MSSEDAVTAFWVARLREDERYVRVMTKGAERYAAATSFGVAAAYAVTVSALSAPDVAKELERWFDGDVPVPNDIRRSQSSIEADRRLLAIHQPEWNEYRDGDGIERSSYDCAECVPPGTPGNWPCLTVRARLATWDEHPDYRPEWKP